MRRQGIAAFGLWALLMCVPCSAAPNRSAVLHTPLQGLAQAEALDAAGDAQGAELLRRGLLQAQLAALAGTPMRPQRVQELVTHAARQGTAIDDAWAAWFNAQVTLRWLGEAVPLELGGLPAGARALATGAWAFEAGGGTELQALVRLENRANLLVPMPPLRLQLQRGPSRLVLDCQPPAAPLRKPPPALADAGEAVPPGAGRPFSCRGNGDAAWAATLARLAGGQPAADEAWTLLPPQAPSGTDIDRLLRGWAAPPPAAAPPAAQSATPAPRPGEPSAWRTTLAVGAVAALLLMLLRTLHARIDGDRSAASAWLRSLPAAGAVLLVAAAIGSPPGQALLGAIGDGAARAMQALMARFPMDRPTAAGARGAAGGSADALAPLFVLWTAGLYGAGRLMLRVGFATWRVKLFTWLMVLLLGPLSAASVWSQPAGEGWSRAVPLVMLVIAFGFFVGVGVAVTLLHAMDDLMEREGTSWPASVWHTLRATLDFSGSARAAELWGYLAFFALAWLLTRLFARPWDLAVALVLLVPLPTLLLRRLRGLGNREAWGLVLLLGVVALELLQRR